MSTASNDRPAAPVGGRLSETEAVPAVPVRRSVLHPPRPALRDEGAPLADWRGQAVTEELAAVPARRSRPARRTRAWRHLRAALVGTLLAIVAITGLSAYAAQGVTDARSTALCQAHISSR